MSSYWAVRCDDCEETGPQFGRKAGGFMTWVDPQIQEAEVGGAMVDFLNEHEWHSLVLVHE